MCARIIFIAVLPRETASLQRETSVSSLNIYFVRRNKKDLTGYLQCLKMSHAAMHNRILTHVVRYALHIKE